MTHALRLLIVEDNPGDVRLVREALADSRIPTVVVEAATLACAGTLLDRGFDAILLDLGLPDSSGMATVIAMRDLAPRIPILVLTGLSDEAAGLEALRLGAQDYLVKGQADGRTLTRAIRYAIERKHFEERLLAAGEALEAANRSLDEFVSVASHDLRDPLAKILALSSILGADEAVPLPARDRSCLLEIGRSARRMQRLIDALLSYARAVRRTPAIEPVALRRIAEEVLDDLAVRIRDSGAVVELQPLPTVMADPVQIRQVLQNLVSNALKFGSAERPPRITISADAQGGTTRVSVADNGVGFAPADAERLFRPFAQTGATREGGGLGLAICRRIIEAHGGEVSASSLPNQGATFTFTLPAAPFPAFRQETLHGARSGRSR